VAGILKIHQEIAGLLGHPASGRVGGDAQGIETARPSQLLCPRRWPWSGAQTDLTAAGLLCATFLIRLITRAA
jgi:hypothetical protein